MGKVPVLLGVIGVWAGSLSAGESPGGAGRFVRTIWSATKGNRFRVNSPDVKTGRYKDRWEARQTGLMTIGVDEDLSQAAGAALYLELWGGHPGVANKRFTLNGKGTYRLPEVGAAAKNCTYSYPAVPLKLPELKRGANAFQFTCERGETFWGHYLIRAAAVRLELERTCPALKEAALAGFTASVTARPHEGKAETLTLSLRVPRAMTSKVGRVEYWGRYRGYDENGDGRGEDWHGYTKDRQAAGIIGSSATPPFAVEWDLSMAPASPTIAARAVVHLKGADRLSYHTAAVEAAFPRRGHRLSLHHAKDLPRPFWSRAGEARSCTLDLDADPAAIERAQLHVIIWDGGKGKTPEPFTLNGRPLPVAGAGRHDVLYRVLDVDPKWLKRGANRIRVLSDTKHHGIEVLLPGPALMIRHRPVPTGR